MFSRLIFLLVCYLEPSTIKLLYSTAKTTVEFAPGHFSNLIVAKVTKSKYQIDFSTFFVKYFTFVCYLEPNTIKLLYSTAKTTVEFAPGNFSNLTVAKVRKFKYQIDFSKLNILRFYVTWGQTHN